MLELGAGIHLTRRSEFDEARVATHLAQFEERVEHNDVAAGEPLLGDLAAHLFVHRDPHRLVEIALRAGELERAQDLGFRRQIGRHQALGAPQQKWFQPARQHGATFAILLFLDRGAEHAREAFGVAEQSRHQEGELRPQLAEMVFHRRAGETQPMACIEAADQLRRLRGGILDRLRLVQHCHVPLNRQQPVGVARQQRVGRHNQIGIVDLGKALGAVGAMQRQDPELGRQPCRLGDPVRHDAGRANDEAGPVKAAFALLDQNMSEGLHRLAQPHIVGKDAAELVSAQKLQPIEPVALIGPQLGSQPSRWLDLGNPRKARQPLRQLPQPLAAEPAQPGRCFESGETRHFTGRYPEFTRSGQVLRVVQLDEGGHDRLRAL